MAMPRNILNSDLKSLAEKFFLDAKTISDKKHEIVHPINHYIDQTLLKPDATLEQIEVLCANARAYDFRAVCIQPHFLNKTKELLPVRFYEESIAIHGIRINIYNFNILNF